MIFGNGPGLNETLEDLDRREGRVGVDVGDAFGTPLVWLSTTALILGADDGLEVDTAGVHKPG